MESVLLIAEKQNSLKQASYATMLSNMASLYQDRGMYDESEKLWKQCVELRKKILGEDHPDYAQSLYGLAGVYFATGKLDMAAPYFTLVAEKYQHQIESYFDALSEREKGAFYNKIKPVFETYQDFSIQLLKQNPANTQIAEKLYDLQLSTKAILLNASNKVRNAILTSGDVELQNLFQKWLHAKEELVRYYNYSAEEKSRLNIDVAQAEQNTNDLEKKLTERSSHFSSLNKKKITWRDVQASLQPNEAAVEIIRIKKKFVPDSIYYAALVVTKQSNAPKLFIWPDGMKLENRWFRYHRNAIKFHLKDTLSYKHIWAPFLNEIPNMQTLYVSSDGVFNKINFNCVQDPVSGKWAVDEFNIRLVSNTREITETHPSMSSSTQQADIFGYADFNLTAASQAETTGRTKRAARFGFQGEEIPMLPATKKELTLLNALLAEKNWKTSTFSLQDASEDNLKKINNPQILHIATHGFFLNDVDIEDELQSGEEVQMKRNPLFRSGILLAGAGAPQNNNQEDGVLTAYEAMNLSLDNTELVSLSACETGLGEVRNGEGVYGLQRSFLVAGARTVIMSLWQVDDDATQELMTTFYGNWINGMDKFRAFRTAQLEIKEKYKLPYYWGAFVLIGN
jgi:CHAT domain-containing protein